MSKTHYCLAGEQHQNGCECDCQICEDKRELQKQEEINKILRARIKEKNIRIKEEIAQDPICQKAYAEAAEIMKNLSLKGKRQKQ